VTPARSAGYVGAHRADTASRTTTRIRPWVHRGLAVGTLTAGLWLAGSLSQASTAEAAPSSAPKPLAVSSTGDATARLGAVDVGSTAVAAGQSSRALTAAPATRISPIKQAETSSVASAAASAAGGLGVLPPTRSDAAGATPPTGTGAARRPVATVVTVAASAIGSVSAVTAPVLRTPVPAIPTLPAPALPSPAALVPAVVVPALPAAPSRPVVPARPAEPVRALPAAQPAVEAREFRAPAATGRNHGWASELKTSDPAASDSASTRKPAGQHLSQHPISDTSAALPQQPSTPPAGHRPSPVPGLGFGGGHHPLDSGLAPTDLSSPGVPPAGDCRGRDRTPPRERASAPSTSPD
jgi:hypothetical protein